jgi:hypothetical protein
MDEPVRGLRRPTWDPLFAETGQESVMTRLSKTALATGLATAAAWVLLAGAAMSQGSCPDGRTGSGQCVNPQLADSMRQGSILYSQPKLSYTHYPVLPVFDWIFRYPRQLNPDPNQPSPGGFRPGTNTTNP